jgi:crossover junction endodeoxyribonuclease RusA
VKLKELALSFTIPGQPVPKGRPRLGKGGNVFTPKKTRSYEYAVGMVAAAACAAARWNAQPPAKSYAVILRVFTVSARRQDLDNVTKCLLDGMNRVVYPDDSLVDELHVYRQLDKERPRVEVLEER